MEILKKLKSYMGNRVACFSGAITLSALSSILGLIPYIFIWLIIKELFNISELSHNKIITYSIYALTAAVLGIALYFGALTLSHLAAFRAEVEIRRKAMTEILKMPLGFFDNNASGKVRKIIDDNASITHTFLAHQLPDMAGTLITPLIIFSSLFIFNWKLGLVSLIPIFLALSIMGFMMGKKGKHFMKIYMDSLEDMNTEAVEYVRGIPVVKVFQQTVYSFKNFYNSIKKYNKYVTEYTKMWEKPMSTYTVIINGFAFFLVPATILLIKFSDNYADLLLNLIFYVLITPLFAQCIMKSMHMNQAFWQAEEAVKRIEKLMEFTRLPIVESVKLSEEIDVVFKNVVFKYPDAHKNVVDNISFKINEGQTFALVGPSGSGKSTIAKLLPRFWDVNDGEILIGGINVKDYEPRDLMERVSFVFQNTKLFKTSILENIRYGNPDATMTEIENAIDLAQCRDIVEKLPSGINTRLGTEGVYLSGGEQQRIALARAILKNAPIVVLDEATAFADPENEYLIQKALKKLTEGKTVLMIAHRLASIKNVDCILVINKGKIEEKGKHKELIDKGGLYSNMWKEYNEAVHWQIGGESEND
ncbi:MAG: ABC transporter ATP-binding protein [Fusobacteriaceae bacterium]|nr:ABC transporter ATP-binding protein [Fusobacteriaceae bacterium]